MSRSVLGARRPPGRRKIARAARHARSAGGLPLHLFEGYGVELEYMIVDRATLAVAPIADRLLFDAAGVGASEVERGGVAWSNELVLHVVELKTNGPRRRLEGVAGELHENVHVINRMLEPRGAMLLPTGAHPLMDPLRETRLWPHRYNAVYEAYNRIFDCRGHGWANLQSAHLNLPFSGDREFGRLHAAVRLLLPVLPALSASTPLLEGRVTGWQDTRLEMYRNNQRRVPAIAGMVIPERAFSRREYRQRILGPIYRAVAPLDPTGILRHEWLNSRGAIARFERGTIEIRLLDMQECPAVDLAIAEAVASALKLITAETWSSYEQQREIAEGRLADLLTNVIRDGQEARIRDPGYLGLLGVRAHGAVTGRDLWWHLLEAAGSAGMEGGTGREGGAGRGGGTDGWQAIVAAILEHGTLASRILRAVNGDAPGKAIPAVYRSLAACLEENQVFLP